MVLDVAVEPDEQPVGHHRLSEVARGLELLLEERPRVAVRHHRARDVVHRDQDREIDPGEHRHPEIVHHRRAKADEVRQQYAPGQDVQKENELIDARAAKVAQDIGERVPLHAERPERKQERDGDVLKPRDEPPQPALRARRRFEYRKQRR